MHQTDGRTRCEEAIDEIRAADRSRARIQDIAVVRAGP